MKNLIYIFILVFLFSCDNENSGDCFQETGAIIQEEVSLGSFNKIVVNRDVELILKEGSQQEIIIETGKNLLNDVVAEVIDNQLVLTDNNTCNYVRSYGVTKVYVTAPNITEIRSSTQYDISSDGVLTYPSLRILSENFSQPSAFAVGNFNLEIDNNSFYVLFNGASNCFVSGKTNNLDVSFSAGGSRFEGENLIAQEVTFWNRGSNDMIVNPQQSITGRIVGVGNVISVNKPPVINVEAMYKGRLIFK